MPTGKMILLISPPFSGLKSSRVSAVVVSGLFACFGFIGNDFHVFCEQKLSLTVDHRKCPLIAGQVVGLGVIRYRRKTKDMPVAKAA